MESPPTSWQFNTLLVILALTILIKAYFASKKSPKNNIKTHQKTTLKHLPQPKGALPFIGHLHHLCTKTTISRTLGSMADTSGPIFALRLGNQQAVVLSSSKTIKDLFTNNDSLTATRPTLALSKHLAYNYASFAISPYGKYWRDIRKISTFELLSIKRLEKMKHIRNFEINSCIKNLFKTLFKYKNNKITLCKWIKYTSFNIALNMIVGKTFSHELYDDKLTFASKFEKLIGKATYFSGVAVPSDFVPGIEWLDLMGLIRSMKEIHHDIDLIIGHWLDEHVKRREVNEIGDGDFMDVMLSNISDGCSMYGYERDTIIKATTLTLLLTGSESTSITLTWAISLLLNNPKALKKAQEELDQKIGKQRWVEESDIPNLSYLQAIVKETLRLYPPSPLAGPREAMEDCHIDGYLISKGTRIIVNIWKMHRDPRIWVRPNEFRPERFINENENIDFRCQNFEYLPFSLGRRACPGMNFGLQVVHLMLARLIQGFDLCSENNEPIDMSEKLGLALPKANPLNVILKARLSTPLYESL